MLNAYINNKTVLFASKNNTAVDTVLKKVAELNLSHLHLKICDRKMLKKIHANLMHSAVSHFVLKNLYLPDWDWGDLKYGAKGGRWQLTPHIYTTPMFYIDYSLAQCCALQFWLKSEENFEETMDSYIRLCKRGGEVSFQDLINSAKLNNPFEEGSLTDVVKRAHQLLNF